jgi:hypothetical protein
MTQRWKVTIDNQGVLITGPVLTETMSLVAGANDLFFDVKPDLTPGQYRWNGEAFDPVNLGQVWNTPTGPDSWYAVFRAMSAIQNIGNKVDITKVQSLAVSPFEKEVASVIKAMANHMDFPAPVKTWLKYYYRSWGRSTDNDPTI